MKANLVKSPISGYWLFDVNGIQKTTGRKTLKAAKSFLHKEGLTLGEIFA